MKRLFKDIRILLMAAATVMIAGCIRDDYTGEPEKDEEIVRGLYIRFRMNIDEDRSAGSRASAAARNAIPEAETPGTNKENAINEVALLFYDADTDTLAYVAYLTETEIRNISKPEGACVPVLAKTGHRVRIYAAVNMTERMRDGFVIGNSRDISYSQISYDNNYRSVINEYVPGSNGKQTTLETLDKGGIPMTGQFLLNETGTDNDVITFTDANYSEATALSVSAKISRIMAKVHVLAKPMDEATPRYAKAMQRASANPQRLGWIRMENVKYIPNGINRSSYILPQENTTANGLSGFKDLNMNLDSYVNEGEFASLLWSDDYVYLDGLRLHSANVNSEMEIAEAYDAGRLALTTGSNDPNRYVRGMYCTENYFDMPADELPFLESVRAVPMITTVVITARLTPRVLLIEKDFKKEMDDFVFAYENNNSSFQTQYKLTEADFTDEDAIYWKEIRDRFDNLPTDHGCLKYEATEEKEAQFIINSSIKTHGLWTGSPMAYESGKFSDGTFYVYDQLYDGVTVTGERYLCLTAGAVSEANEEYIAIRARSVPHLGGWGYYYTYIDNNGSTGETGKTPYTASQVTRNSYYIITVNNFSEPGGTVSSPDYIKVNTDKVGWDYTGRGDIYLH